MSGGGARRARRADRFAVGRVRRAHGVRGYVRFESLSGEIDHFPAMREVELRGCGRPARRYRVESFRLGAPTLLMKLDGVDDRDAAAALAGREIWVDRRHAAPLGPDEYYVADLAGCLVRQEGRTVGAVRTVLETGAGDVLETVGAGGRTVLIPFRRRYVRSADVDAGVIELAGDAVVE